MPKFWELNLQHLEGPNFQKTNDHQPSKKRTNHKHLAISYLYLGFRDLFIKYLAFSYTLNIQVLIKD